MALCGSLSLAHSGAFSVRESQREFSVALAFVESSTKAGSGCLLLRALRKHDGFCSKFYESRVAFVESSTKAGWLLFKVLRK